MRKGVLLFLLLFSLTGCFQPSTLFTKEDRNVAKGSVASIRVQQDQLVINGSELNDITEVRIVGNNMD